MNSKTVDKNFTNNGYCIINLFSKSQIKNIKKNIIKKLLKLETNTNFLKNLNLNNLKDYHKLKIPEKIHKDILKTSTRYINLDSELIEYLSNNRYLKSIMISQWGHNDTVVNWVGSLKKKQIKQKVVGFRISRPSKSMKKDATGIHCDLHVGGKICSDKKVLVTAWVPLIGFNEKYSLNLSPKSHIPNHPIDNFIKGKTVTNVYSKNYYKNLKFLRPKLKEGQAIIFHPNLLHGNSFNVGTSTRISIEIRFYNKKNIKFWKIKK